MVSPEFSTQIVPEPQKPAQERNFQNTLDFLAEATPTPRYLRTTWPPRHKNQTETNWQRNFAIAGRYFGTDDTLDEIGSDHHLTRERIRQIVKRCVLALYKSSDFQTRSRFPIEKFSFDKHPAREAKKIKMQLIENLRKLADPDLPYYETQKILDIVTRSKYQVLSRGENPVLVPISDLARNAGLFFSPRDFRLIIAVLKKTGVGIGFIPSTKYRRKSGEQIQIGYHFIRTLDRDKAVSMLKQTPEVEHLKTNPVAVLGILSAEIPSVYKLQSGEFASVMNLVAEIRGRRLNQKSRTKLVEIISADCPVSVYMRKKCHYYLLDQKEELKAYLTKRLKELGLL